jgi:transposase
VASERDTPENRERRREFCALLAATSARRFVFIDESFCKTGMRREYGWSLRGERALGTRPFRAWKTVSLIGAIRLGARPKLMTHRGPVNGRVFLRFAKQRLAPWLRRGDIVVMDNLNMHKMKTVRAAIEAVGARVIFLPTYSPELNPIELWWADLKRHLRTLGINVEAELARAVRRLRASVPEKKIAGWFRRAWSQAQVKRSPC